MADALSSENSDEIAELEEALTGADAVGAEGEATVEPEDVEITIEESGSRPEKVATQDSVNRLVGRLTKAKAATRDVEVEAERLRQENELLQLALQQKREEVQLPNPADFDEGVSDPKYVEATGAYIESVAERARQAPTPVPTSDPNLEQARRAHAERAVALGVKDYSAVQDAAIETLGGQVVNEIIKASDQSELVLYFYGKNAEKAEAMRNLIETNPVKAAIEIGRLSAGLTVKSKAKTQSAPDPDEEPQGSSPSGNPRRGPKGATFE